MLEGEHIILRKIKKNDVDTIFELTHKYRDMPDTFPQSLLHELIYVKHFGYGHTDENSEECLLITDKKDNIMGCIACFKGLRYVEGLELTYHIFRPVHRGKGYAKEALELMIKYLLETKKIPRLQINTESDNTPGRKTAEACGFTYEGTMKKAILTNDGKWKDLAMFSLFRLPD
jgi:RimJ/RimL family protein N-acetyltransferase